MDRVNWNLVNLVAPGTDEAVFKALHKADPIKFHKRVRGECPFCVSAMEELTEKMKKNLRDIAKNKEQA